MRSAHILIVEDEVIIAQSISNRLKDLGYTVPGIALSGEQAIKMAQESQPGIVLMDIRLSGSMDGIEAAEQIRSRFDIPVIYLTAYLDDDTIQRAKLTEPFGYILKPFDSRELRITIDIALYKHQMERQLRQNQKWCATMLQSIGDAVIATDVVGKITFMNPAAERLTGWKLSEAEDLPLAEVWTIFDERTREPITIPGAESLEQGGTNLGAKMIICTKSGVERPIAGSVAPIQDDANTLIGVVLTLSDETERRKAEYEREQLIAQLEEALAKIRILRGLLPVCASCKRIRDRDGQWQNIETYLHKHSEASFTHTICPECVHKLYGDLLDDVTEA